jgi:hypothetical protein
MAAAKAPEVEGVLLRLLEKKQRMLARSGIHN